MQIVIDISDSIYNYIHNEHIAMRVCDSHKVAQAIANGTPLPKGHGRLIDENDLMPDSDYEDGIFYAVSIGMIKRASTIIEADKAEGEE